MRSFPFAFGILNRVQREFERFRSHFVTNPIVVHWIVARHSSILYQFAFGEAPVAWSI
jgi:hypothetical protein